MRVPGKQQLFICVLISLLVYGLSWGLLPNIGEHSQAQAYRFDSSAGLPQPNSESNPASSPLWQAIQSNIILAPGATFKSSSKVPGRGFFNSRTLLGDCRSSAGSGHARTAFFTIDRPNYVFKFTGGQTFQHLDIPPPHTWAYL